MASKKKKEPTEQDFENLLNGLRSRNPLWKEYEELGKLLFIHVDDMTQEQKDRKTELETIIRKQEEQSSQK